MTIVSPVIGLLVFLSAAFILGLALGWIWWRFNSATSVASLTSEREFWQQRFEQARRARDLDQDRIAILEAEKSALQKRLPPRP